MFSCLFYSSLRCARERGKIHLQDAQSVSEGFYQAPYHHESRLKITYSPAHLQHCPFLQLRVPCCQLRFSEVQLCLNDLKGCKGHCLLFQERHLSLNNRMPARRRNESRHMRCRVSKMYIYISRGCASSVSLRRQIVSSFQFRSMLHFRQVHVRRFRRPELLLCNQSRVSGSLHLRRHLLLSVEKVLAW